MSLILLGIKNIHISDKYRFVLMGDGNIHTFPLCPLFLPCVSLAILKMILAGRLLAVGYQSGVIFVSV